MNISPTRKHHCEQCCVPTTQRLHKTITSSGAVFVGWVCDVCNSWVKSKVGGNWIPHDLLAEYGVEIDRLPIRKERPRGGETMSLF